MTTEEAFKIIRNFLDEVIGIYKNQIEELEEQISLIEKSKVLAVAGYKKWAETGKAEVYNILATKEFTELKEKNKATILESEEKYSACCRTRECFGKKGIIKKVVDIEAFFINLNIINYGLKNIIDRETIAKIIGMVIYTNNSIYEKKKTELENVLNSEHSYLKKECQAVISLKPYFNSDGTIIANSNIGLFVENLTTLFTVYVDRNIDTGIPKEEYFSVSMLIDLMIEELLKANRNKPKVVEPSNTAIHPIVTKKERRQIREQLMQNEQELATYFDGEQILRPCASIEKFKLLVDNCNLSEENKARIISKMNTFLNKNSSLEKISFLSMEEQRMYKLALEKQLGNIQIKKVIEEINMLLEMNDDSISKEEKEYIENEVKALIDRLNFILNSKSIVLGLQNNRKGNLYDN